MEKNSLKKKNGFWSYCNRNSSEVGSIRRADEVFLFKMYTQGAVWNVGGGYILSYYGNCSRKNMITRGWLSDLHSVQEELYYRRAAV